MDNVNNRMYLKYKVIFEGVKRGIGSSFEIDAAIGAFGSGNKYLKYRQLCNMCGKQ